MKPRIPLIMLSILLVFSSVFAQKKIVIAIDHTADSVEVEIWRGDVKKKTIQTEGGEVFVPSAKNVIVEVRNTNTLFYQHSLTKKTVEAKDYKTIQSFLMALGPYAIDLSTILNPVGKEGQTQDGGSEELPLISKSEIVRGNYTQELVNILELIDAQISGEDGLLDTYLTTEVLLGSIAADPVAGATELKELLEDRFLPADSQRLQAVENLYHYYDSLKTTFYLFERELNQGSTEIKKDYEVLRKRVIKALGEAQSVLNIGYAFEAFAVAALDAKHEKTFNSFQLKWTKAKVIELNIVRNTTKILTRHDTLKPYNLNLTLQPRNGIKPVVGLSFLISPKSTFSKFSTKEVGTEAQIVESSLQDSRYTWGFTLGAHIPLTLKNNWLDVGPEVIVNPSDDIKALGLGGGFTIKNLFKFSIGGLWTKHLELDGQKVGDILGNSGDLKTKESYGTANLYFGISIIGWPPFVSK